MSAQRLFIVDDLPAARLLVRAVAEDLGFTIAGESPDGESACTDIPAAAPDVVVMDWAMPGVDGLEATARLRAVMPQLCVIAYTSTSNPDVRARFLELGVQAYVRKGDVAELVSALEGLAAGSTDGVT